jgi:hypothetical protein
VSCSFEFSLTAVRLSVDSDLCCPWRIPLTISSSIFQCLQDFATIPSPVPPDNID